MLFLFCFLVLPLLSSPRMKQKPCTFTTRTPYRTCRNSTAQLFGMIRRLPEKILHKLAISKLLTEADSSSSWFVQIRLLCVQYNLPSPLILLYQPRTKASFTSLVKAKVVDFWEAKYRAEAAPRTSLEYFKPEFLSLLHPHPLWTTCRNNSFEVNKSIVVARLMSGRYFSD